MELVNKALDMAKEVKYYWKQPRPMLSRRRGTRKLPVWTPRLSAIQEPSACFAGKFPDWRCMSAHRRTR